MFYFRFRNKNALLSPRTGVDIIVGVIVGCVVGAVDGGGGATSGSFSSSRVGADGAAAVGVGAFCSVVAAAAAEVVVLSTDD